MSNNKTLPTPSRRRSAHNTPVLISSNIARGCPAGGTLDPWGSEEAHPDSARHSVRRRSIVLALAAASASRRNKGLVPSAAESFQTHSTLTPCTQNNAQAAFTGPEAALAAPPYSQQAWRLRATCSGTKLIANASWPGLKATARCAIPDEQAIAPHRHGADK